MTKIRPNLYIGHEYDAHMDPIRDNGITVSLNVAHDLNDPIYWSRSKCLNIKVGLADKPDNRPDMIKLAIDTLKHLLDSGHCVLIHCRAGASRSPYIVAHYLMEKENRLYDDIWKEIRSLRPEVLEKSKLYHG